MEWGKKVPKLFYPNFFFHPILPLSSLLFATPSPSLLSSHSSLLPTCSMHLAPPSFLMTPCFSFLPPNSSYLPPRSSLLPSFLLLTPPASLPRPSLLLPPLYYNLFVRENCNIGLQRDTEIPDFFFTPTRGKKSFNIFTVFRKTKTYSPIFSSVNHK